MAQFTCFKINKHITLQETVIEDQVDIEVLLIKCKTFLARLKKKAFAQL